MVKLDDIDINEKEFGKHVATLVNLEYLGSRLEDVKEEMGPFGIPTLTSYYYSVPEVSTIEVENENENELNILNKTADGLKRLTKDSLTRMIIAACKERYDDDEFIDDLTENMSKYVKFYAKVRKGEVWTEEMGRHRIEQLRKELHESANYDEV